MASSKAEKSIGPIIIGSLALFLLGVIGTVTLPFYDSSMQKPNANAELRHYAPNTPEARGRVIYIREGCHVCHTQFVRPVKADSNLGPVSAAGDYFYDAPPLLGTVRTGADLMWVGKRWNAEWLIRNLKNPREMLPGSNMPRYNYLSDQELSDLAAYLLSLRPAPQTEGH